MPSSNSTGNCYNPVPISISDDNVLHFHTHAVGPNQCCSAVLQTTAAPVSVVWSVVGRFDKPQAYKHFLRSCRVIVGDGKVGTLREVHVVSGLPAASSTEKLEILDDERHVISFSIVGGDHRLKNYRSITTLHPGTGGSGTLVVESYVVDVPPSNTNEETCVFVDTIVRFNLQSLAQIAEAKTNRLDLLRESIPPPPIFRRSEEETMEVVTSPLGSGTQQAWYNLRVDSAHVTVLDSFLEQHPSLFSELKGNHIIRGATIGMLGELLLLLEYYTPFSLTPEVQHQLLETVAVIEAGGLQMQDIRHIIEEGIDCYWVRNDFQDIDILEQAQSYYESCLSQVNSALEAARVKVGPRRNFKKPLLPRQQ